MENSGASSVAWLRSFKVSGDGAMETVAKTPKTCADGIIARRRRGSARTTVQAVSFSDLVTCDRSMTVIDLSPQKSETILAVAGLDERAVERSFVLTRPPEILTFAPLLIGTPTGAMIGITTGGRR